MPQRLTVKQIERGRAEILSNARALVGEAQILLRHKRYARAYALSHLASEELAKLPMLVRAAVEAACGASVDWKRLDAWSELHDFVQALLQLRRSHQPHDFRFYGAQSAPDTSLESRSLAWSAGGLYVMANSWWEPVSFEFQEPGPWTLVFSTAGSAAASGTAVVPRSMVVWRCE